MSESPGPGPSTLCQQSRTMVTGWVGDNAPSYLGCTEGSYNQGASLTLPGVVDKGPLCVTWRDSGANGVPSCRYSLSLAAHTRISHLTAARPLVARVASLSFCPPKVWQMAEEMGPRWCQLRTAKDEFPAAATGFKPNQRVTNAYSDESTHLQSTPAAHDWEAIKLTLHNPPTSLNIGTFLSPQDVAEVATLVSQHILYKKT